MSGKFQLPRPRFAGRLRIVCTMYLLLGLMVFFQNCNKSEKLESTNSGFVVSSITGQGLKDQTVTVGDRVNFIVDFQNIPQEAVFQWKKNGQNFGSTLSNNNFISSVALSDQGTYEVNVVVGATTLVRAKAVLTVQDPTATPEPTTPSTDTPTPVPPTSPDSSEDDSSLAVPVFLQHPVGLTVLAGSFVSFSSVATGDPEPTFQWQKDGVDISGADGPTLFVTDVKESDTGTYQVTASNSEGSVLSLPAILVVDMQNITCDFAGYTILPGQTLIGPCKGKCQGKKWVGAQTSYRCEPDGDIVEIKSRCFPSPVQMASCSSIQDWVQGNGSDQ